MGIKDIFCESGEPSALWEKYELNEKHMIKKAKRTVILDILDRMYSSSIN